MVRFFLLTLLLLSFDIISAQETISLDSLSRGEEIFSIVDQMPEFPDGENAMFKFLAENVKYPPKDREKGNTGTVYVSFIVDRNGKIKEIKAVKEVKDAPGLTTEAIRVIALMPDWKPGVHQGKTVPVLLNIPLKFSLGIPRHEYFKENLELCKELNEQQKFQDALILINKSLKEKPDQPNLLFERVIAKKGISDLKGACRDCKSIIENGYNQFQNNKAREFIANNCRGDLLNEDSNSEIGDEVFSIIEQAPMFPGGEEAMFKFLANNVRYPENERDKGFSGVVYISFIVGADGKLSDIKTVKEVSGAPGLTTEAIRVISLMPKWTPGRQRGENVPVHYNIPIRFSIKNDTSSPKWIPLLNECSFLNDKKKFKEAILKADKALVKFPNQPNLLFERAYSKKELQNFQGACDDWQLITENDVDPKDKEKANGLIKKYCIDIN